MEASPRPYISIKNPIQGHGSKDKDSLGHILDISLSLDIISSMTRVKKSKEDNLLASITQVAALETGEEKIEGVKVPLFSPIEAHDRSLHDIGISKEKFHES